MLLSEKRAKAIRTQTLSKYSTSSHKSSCGRFWVCFIQSSLRTSVSWPGNPTEDLSRSRSCCKGLGGGMGVAFVRRSTELPCGEYV